MLAESLVAMDNGVLARTASCAGEVSVRPRGTSSDCRLPSVEGTTGVRRRLLGGTKHFGAQLTPFQRRAGDRLFEYARAGRASWSCWRGWGGLPAHCKWRSVAGRRKWSLIPLVLRRGLVLEQG